MITKIGLPLAAAAMGKDPAFVRIGLQRGLLPFGVAIKKREGRFRKYSYYISPPKFLSFTGLSEDELREMAEEGGYPLK